MTTRHRGSWAAVWTVLGLGLGGCPPPVPVADVQSTPDVAGDVLVNEGGMDAANPQDGSQGTDGGSEAGPSRDASADIVTDAGPWLGLEHCRERNVATCQRLEACDPTLFHRLFLDQSQCAVGQEPRCFIPQFTNSADVRDQTACLAYLQSESCEQFIREYRSLDYFAPHACGLADGAIPLGGDCVHDYQCPLGAVCTGYGTTESCMFGSCVPTRAMGETCTLEARCDGRATSCLQRYEPTTGTVSTESYCLLPYQHVGNAGDPCHAGTDYTCKLGSTCDATTHTCLAPLPEGAACTSLLDCDFIDSVFCINNVCVRPNTLALGEACGGAVACTGGTYCDTALPAPICVRTKGLDEACTIQTQCTAGLTCRAGSAGGALTCQTGSLRTCEAPIYVLTGPDGGDDALLSIDGPAVEGTIDERDLTLGSFSTANTERRGDQYRVDLPTSGPYVISVEALVPERNIVDYVIEARPTDDRLGEFLTTDSGASARGECMVLDAASVPTHWSPLPVGSWTLRVLSFRAPPTPTDLRTSTSRYNIRVQTGTVCMP